MPRAKHFSAEEKAMIQAWIVDDIPPKEMAARLGRNVAAVRKWVVKLRSYPPTMTPPPAKRRCGRPRLTTPKQDLLLRHHVLRHPFKTAKQLKADVPGYSKVSVRQIQKILQRRLGLPSRRAAAKPLLTERMTKQRIRFCRKHLHMTADDWMNVMFSDESTFRLVNPRAQQVRRPRNISRYLQRFTVKTVKHPAQIMVWGCFSGRGGLWFLKPGLMMNSDRYIEVLEQKVIPWMERHRCKFFLQDGAPCHKSKRSMAVLKRMEDKFKVMDWPGNSPDLNPIENLWSIMKAKLKRDHTITSVEALKKALLKLWCQGLDQDQPDLFVKLARSMPGRLQKVLEAKGQMTKY